MGEEPDITGWLIHGTQEYSIRKNGLKAGGISGSRKHIHFILDTRLMSNQDAIRETSDVLLVYNPADITAHHSAVRAPNGYILLLGAWSLKNSTWIDMPNAPTLRSMFHNKACLLEFTQPSSRRHLCSLPCCPRLGMHGFLNKRNCLAVAPQVLMTLLTQLSAQSERSHVINRCLNIGQIVSSPGHSPMNKGDTLSFRRDSGQTLAVQQPVLASQKALCLVRRRRR